MMQWLGEVEASTILLDVVETICEKGITTRDLGGTASTKEVTSAVCDEVERRFSKRIAM
jgi:isocitrate/isopropylmalate dehydrogenase